MDHQVIQNGKFDPLKSYHKYTVKWKPNVIQWYVDGVNVKNQTTSALPTESMSIRVIQRSINASPSAYLGTAQFSTAYIKYTQA